MRFGLAKSAGKDLASAVTYLADRNPQAARQLIDDVLDLGQRLADGDFDGVEVQLKSGMKVRSWPLPPYRVYYRRQPRIIEIMRVYHQARRPITK